MTSVVPQNIQSIQQLAMSTLVLKAGSDMVYGSLVWTIVKSLCGGFTE